LAEHKRQLLARSESHRQSLEMEIRHIKAATAWVPRALHLARSVYPIALLAVPLVGLILGKKVSPKAPAKERPAVKGLAATALTGWNIYRKVKPFWDGFRSARR